MKSCVNPVLMRRFGNLLSKLLLFCLQELTFNFNLKKIIIALGEIGNYLKMTMLSQTYYFSNCIGSSVTMKFIRAILKVVS